ncbi:MAG TPA: baseplate J/gp47 family protein [Xanthobacteraceae bacterium]|nr:baseplate J/gp47 family protein [Xanthobacteraceae bacterium]
MSFSIPTLPQLLERSRQSLRTNLPGTDAWVWPNNLNVVAKVFAGIVFEVFAFAEYISRQMFAQTADGDSLDRHGNEYGMPRLPAEPARGVVVLTTTGPVTVEPSAVFERGDGVRYRSLTPASIGGTGTLEVEVVAVANGKAGSLDAGAPLALVAGVTGPATAVVGAGGIVGGADVEDDEAYRQRILFRKRYPPHGGSASDYVMWAKSVSGVSRVFVERLWAGAGTVRIFVLMDDLYPHGIAPDGEVARVADYIAAVCPAGAMVTVAAPTPVPVNITITGLEPDTTSVREAVLSELRDAFARESRPAGTDTTHGGMSFLSVPTSFSRSWIWQAVANATGETRHIVTAPAADVTLNPGEIATLGTVTFA